LKALFEQKDPFESKGKNILGEDSVEMG